MNNEIIQALINRVISDEATPEEKCELLAWVEASEENKRAFAVLKNASVLAGTNTGNQVQDQAYVEERYGEFLQHSKFRGGSMPRSHRFNKGQLKISLPRLAAAVISIIGLSIAFSYLFFHESKVQTVDNKLVVPSGQQAQLTLSDGTKIWLNSRSELRYPGNFTGNNREVFLDGEAYFEVTHDPDMPFIVRSKYLGIKVLGTSFNFSAYKDDAAIRMTLVEGLVSIIDSRNKMLLQLKPQQTAVYSKASKRITLSGGDTDIYISWREGQFKFRKMSFDEISSRLGRNFNVVFRIQNEEMKHTTFSGSFYNYESLDQILRILQRNYPFHYEINGNEVLIK